MYKFLFVFFLFLGPFSCPNSPILAEDETTATPMEVTTTAPIKTEKAAVAMEEQGEEETLRERLLERVKLKQLKSEED